MEGDINFTDRLLGPSEVVTDLLHQYGTSLLVHIALVHTKVKVTEADIEESLNILSNYQPILKKNISGNAEQFFKGRTTKRFVELEDFSVPYEIRQCKGKQAWISVVEDELKDTFEPGNGPLWKLLYLELDRSEEEGASITGSTIENTQANHIALQDDVNAAILFKIHHSLADNISMHDTLQNQFMVILNRVLRSENCEEFSLPLQSNGAVDTSFCRNERLSSRRRKTLKRTSSKQKFHQRAPVFKDPILKITQSGPSQSESKSQFKIIAYNLPVIVSQSLLNENQKKGLNIDNALRFACASAIAIYHKIHGVPLGDDILVCGQNDMRQYRTVTTPYPLERWVTYTTSKVTKNIDLLPSMAFWKKVEKAGKNINVTERELQKDLLSKKELVSLIAMNGAFAAAVEPYRSHIEFSSINPDQSLPPQGEDVITIREYHFTKSVGEAAPSPLALNACYHSNHFQGCLTYDTKWISKEFATEILTIFKAVLKRATEPTNSVVTMTLPPMMRARQMRC